MKASEVEIPDDAFVDSLKSPKDSMSYYEYAVESGGCVLSPRRYRTYEDAYFYGCALKNTVDREKYGRVMIKRRVVRRKVIFGEWEEANDDSIERKKK